MTCLSDEKFALFNGRTASDLTNGKNCFGCMGMRNVNLKNRTIHAYLINHTVKCLRAQEP